MPKRKHAPSEAEEEAAAAASDPSASEDEFPSNSESSPPTSEDDEDGAAFDSIDVAFECAAPEEEDFHGLKTLLTNYLDGAQYGCSGLVEAVTSAPAAAVIKCGEGEDPIGVAAVLPLAAHAEVEALGELRAFLAERAPGGGAAAALDAAWAAPGAALLISERLLNSPPQLAPPLMDSIAADVADAGHDISHYIFVTRAYADPTAAAPAAKKGKKKKAAKKAAEGGGEDMGALIFATPEGEFLAARASLAFSFAVPNRAVGKDDLVPRRVVAVVPAAEVAAALAEMREVVGGVEGGDE